ncbi:MAG: HEAT repeat domain-containing protein, partial [Planctomycetaceae bacterium]|nr:HEAT repeat domain-containing protein [Planctomycetaceae bacterium]
AAALFRSDSPKDKKTAGKEALQRLMLCPDWKVRLYTARTLENIKDETLIPLLIPLLDDRDDICAAAMNSLIKIVGKDIGEIAVENEPDLSDKSSLQKKAARWKRYLANDI